MLDELLTEHATSELWNDWATIQFLRGNHGEAQRGYSRSLELDPSNHQAELNLGLVHWKLGEHDLAKLWIDKALPFMPVETQTVIHSTLAKRPEPRKDPSSDQSSCHSPSMGVPGPTPGRPMQVLVIHDTFPLHQEAALDRLLMQVLIGLRELGHAVTFIARDEVNRDQHEAALRKLGIVCYAGDTPRMHWLATEIGHSGWSFEQILSAHQFDIAILTQTFMRGISIPEQYLDDIRKHSSTTRIAILAGGLCGRTILRQAEITQKIEELEWGNDLSQREIEGFERADFVLLANPLDVKWLQQKYPSLNVAWVAHAGYTTVDRSKVNAQNGILFVGDFEIPGCLEGFDWFMRCVWPILERSDPTLELLLAIENVPKEPLSLLAGRNWSGMRDLPRLLESARLFIAPHRYGVQPLSIFGMLANGLPGVVTTAALEDSGLDEGTGVMRADTPDNFASAVLRLYSDQRLRNDLSNKGRNHIDEQGSAQAQRRQLVRGLEQLYGLKAKPASEHSWSMMLIDSLFKAYLSQKSGQELRSAQVELYIRLGFYFLYDRRNPSRGIEQLRHVFGRVNGTIARGPFLAGVLTCLAGCYRRLGDSRLAEDCAAQARLCFSHHNAAKSLVAPRVGAQRASSRVFSVIVPTFNRLPILKKCLAALEAQSLSPDDFEVIVIDDGSSDGTEEMLRSYRPQFAFRYLRQKNSGTGRARRNGISHAVGEYLLLMNDDSVFEEHTLLEHVRARQKYGPGKWAILGNFEYSPAEARQRALSYFCRIEPFMFPQVAMEEGCPYGYSHFITCNISIKRSVVLDAGSFDPAFKHSEDTEIGLRLHAMGYRVLYHPRAHAWHDHLPITMGNLIRRLHGYGPEYLDLMQKYPRIIQEWVIPVHVTAIDEPNTHRVFEYVASRRVEVENAVASLERWDHLDFAPILDKKPELAAEVMHLFKQTLPTVYWFYLFEAMLETMQAQLGLIGFANGRAHQPANHVSAS